MRAPGQPSVPAVGIAFTPFETRPRTIVATAQDAERHGFDAVAVAEAMSLAAPVVLAQLALATERLELCASVLSPWGRTPGTLALTAAQLQQLSGGRFVLGLGASTAPLAEGFHGVRWERPLGTLRDTVVAVRALLAGERLPQVPEGARALRLAVPPAVPVPVGIAAITPASIRLAGALADRWLPFLLPPAALDEGRVLLEASAEQAGRTDRATVTAAVPVAVGPDEASAATSAARWLVTYCRSMGPVYPRMLRDAGYGREIDALLDANTDPRSPVLPRAAERLAREVLLFAPYDEAREACRPWLQHADALSLVLPFASTDEELQEVLSAVAPIAVSR